MEITNKRKTDEDQQEHSEKRNGVEQDEQAPMEITSERKMDEQQEWKKFVEEPRAGAERRAEENKRARVGDDVEGDAMMGAIGAVGLSESDWTYIEAAENFINLLCEETFGEFYDAISGEALDSE